MYGGGDLAYRLREGIECFLVTDINNPAVSAPAQSAIATMRDKSKNTQNEYVRSG